MRLIIAFLVCLSIISASTIKDAKKAHKDGEFEKAFKLYKQAVLEDEPEAFYQLGKFYYEGKEVERDYHKAYKYLTAAHFLDYEKATYNLGIFYSKKNTPYHDYRKAFKTFLYLAQRGNDKAQNRVGMFYTFGMGMKKDYKEAVRWYEKSAKQHYVDAQCNLAFMYASGKGVWQNMGRAHAFARPGYEKGNRYCKKVWKDFKLKKYPEDKGWKLKFYNKPE